jgi:hypothetical protein
VIEQVAGDTVIDVEVTSNRGDCLSHVGVARELAALLDREFKDVTPPSPKRRSRRPARCRPDRRPRPLPALHRPGDPRREGRPEPGLDAAAAARPSASARSTTWST